MTLGELSEDHSKPCDDLNCWAALGNYRTSLRVSSQIVQSKGLIILVHLSPHDECEVSAVETDTSGSVVTTQWVFLSFELDNLHFSFSLSSEHLQEKSAAWVWPRLFRKPKQQHHHYYFGTPLGKGNSRKHSSLGGSNG